ncbi:hypothetical protein CLV98_1415 [Dyadobacter jejuensis]|uniref:Uncharacterized protein n=1 Tax=Dyadobacter jejuensis TaxID=1082580 RepID=A0A315ZZ66_9BACT|nr:hypothetical protein [Dyadobacter jejuensis]PWJ50623.1 hypothetical protein CLV98_1415 [Dyadobacter jejuensis]
MKSRRTLGTSTKKALSPERKEAQKEKATCFMVIKFHDGNTWSKWSNEHAQPNKFLNINDSLNEMFRVCQHYFAGRIHSAAIFDVRVHKNIGAHNKIYQFEKGCWQLVQPVGW